MVEYGHQDKRQYDLESTFERSSSFGMGNKYRLHPIGATCANVDLKFLKIKNSLYSNFLANLRKIIKHHNVKLQTAEPKSKPAGFCQGIALSFHNSKEAQKFITIFKKNRINAFQRNYLKTMEEHSINIIKKDCHTNELFRKVVYLDILQFRNPLRLWRFLKVISE